MKANVLVLLVCLLAVTATVSAEQRLAMDEVGHAMSMLGKNLSANLGSSHVLGQPVVVGNVTIIPVVVKCLGFGLGTKLEATDEKKKAAQAGKEAAKQRNRVTLGGGGMARPVALIVIAPEGKVEVIRLHKNALAQILSPFIPVIKDFLGRMFQLKKMQMETRRSQPKPKPSQTPAKPVHEEP